MALGKTIKLTGTVLLLLFSAGWISKGSLAVIGAFCLFVGIFFAGLLLTYRRSMRKGENSIFLSFMGRVRCMKLLSAVFPRWGNSSFRKRQQDRDANAKHKIIANNSVAKETGGVCLYGDSVFTYWTTLQVKVDLAPFKPFNSAFGGSTTTDLLLHIEHLVLRWAPKMIVYYGGSNDISAGATPEATVTGFIKFVKEATEKIPNVVIVYICPMKAPLFVFRNLGSAVDEVCRLAFLYEEKQKNLLVCDPNEEEWVLHPQYYLNDGLHLTQKGRRKLGVKMLPTMKQAWQRIK